MAVVRGVLTPAETADVRRRLLEAADRSDAAGIATRGYAFDADSRNRRVFMLFNWDPVFLRLIEHPLAVRFVERALGESFLVSNFSANVTAPGSGEMTLHADQYYVPPPWGERMFAMNVAWLLDDFTDENGGTRVVPGSHRSGRPPAADEAPATVAVEGPAGSIMVMDGRLWHRTGANRTADQHRAALFGYYIQPWLRPQMNWNAVLAPEVAARLAPVMRERLGLDHGLTEIPR
jgi:ectoine hydroxylase-related dioxygenase (phytanoyl-CoA dioxygenase family)